MKSSFAKLITLSACALALLHAPAISSAADSAPKKEAAPKKESVKDKVKKKLETRPGPAAGAVRG